MNSEIEESVGREFDEAISLRNQGKLLEAASKLEHILSLDPTPRAAILGVLAHIYYKMRDFENADRRYSEAIRLSPDSELASLGYFHTLWDMGRERDAVAEAKRFLTRNTSEEYIALAQEMSDAFKDIP